MASMIKTITDDVVTILSNASLSQTLVIQTVSLDPEIVLKKMSATEYIIQVVPLKVDSTRSDRGSSLRDYTIGVGIFKKISDKTLTTSEPALLLTEEILDLLDIDGVSVASFREIENDPAYDVGELSSGLYFSVVNVTYTARRPA